uniref:Uncharacterized mitochondrial protein AtMg00810-like n=1 Tax=Tanacetum cinerariifolium TaxID=118510 RepID=A0A699GLH8_TANCI|nr:uncharacterized mitochondrial protein AtMg00810-like [Tanacetum cinerariifolium]
MNFVSKFLGTVRFRNDHVARIIGYGDYQLGNVTISRVYYVEGLGHKLFSVGQFCDVDLEVAFRKNTCFIRNLEGIVPNPVSQQPCIPPNRDDCDHLFQPMFDEYFNPPSIAVYPVLVASAPRAVDLADSPVSTSVDKDAPSTSILLTQEQKHSLIISYCFEESPKTPLFHDDPFNESPHEDSTSQGPSSNVLQFHTLFKHLDTPLVEKSKLDEDLQGKPVDATLYRGTIGSLMYLTSSRPDLTYAVCLCARYQAKLTEKHLNTIKQIFRYLKGTINMGLWYSKDTDISLTAYADVDHVGCQDTRRNTSRSVQFLSDKLVSWSSKKQKSTVENGIVELYLIRTKNQPADIFTKPLPRERFNFLIEKLGMKSMSLKMLKRLAEETDE